MKKYGVTDAIGGIMALFGAAGAAEAITGRGSFEISIIVFVIGFVLCLWGYIK